MWVEGPAGSTFSPRVMRSNPFHEAFGAGMLSEPRLEESQEEGSVDRGSLSGGGTAHGAGASRGGAGAGLQMKRMEAGRPRGTRFQDLGESPRKVCALTTLARGRHFSSDPGLVLRLPTVTPHWHAWDTLT